jgi:hypothetical protein
MKKNTEYRKQSHERQRVVKDDGRGTSDEYLAPLVRAEPAGARRFTWGSQISHK